MGPDLGCRAIQDPGHDTPSGRPELRVLLVNDLPPAPVGGAEIHVGLLRAALADAGHTVEIHTAERLHTGVRRVLDLWDPAARRSLRHHVDRFRPDVVHLHNITNELSTSVLGLGPPTVLTVHDPRLFGVVFGSDQRRHRLAPDVVARAAKDRLARARLRRHVSATIVPGAHLLDEARRHRFPAPTLVENFTTIPHDADRRGTDLVFVGTIAEHKGIRVLLDAWSSIEHRFPDVTLRLIGDGPLRDEVEQLVARPPLLGRTQVLGRLGHDGVKDELAGAAIVVVPSIGRETFPLVVIEAMAAGRPVVVSDWPGVRSSVDDGVGAVVPPGDTTALADTLAGLLDDPDGLTARGRAAAGRARSRWAPEPAVRAITAVYRRVIGSGIDAEG